MAQGTMKLIDPETGLMRCTRCGGEHYASLRTAGRYQRGSRQCVNGCKPKPRRKRTAEAQ